MGEVDEDVGALVGLGLDFDLAAVFADDAADDEEAEAGAGGFRGAVGFEEAAHLLGRDAGAVVGDGNQEIGFRGAGADPDHAVFPGDGLVGVADEVVENLLKLIGIDQGHGELRREIEIHGDAAGNDFRFEQGQGLAEDGVEVAAVAAGGGGADGVEELLEDGVEPLDFLAGGVHVLGEALAVGGGEAAEFPLHELEVDVEGVERVPDLVGDAGGEQGEGVEALGFQGFLGLGVAAGEVADQHHVAEGLLVFLRAVDGREVEIEFPVLGVKHLDVPGNGHGRAA